jgi:hypothetical protein
MERLLARQASPKLVEGPGLFLRNLDAPAEDVSLGIGSVSRSRVIPCLARFSDPNGGHYRFLFGAAAATVSTVSWWACGEVYATSTFRIPGDDARRAYLAPVDDDEGGVVLAMAADGTVVERCVWVGDPEADAARELHRRWRDLPRMSGGEFPGGRWVLEAGMRDGELVSWFEVEHGGGGGSVGPPIEGAIDLKLDHLAGRPPGIQVAVGQLSSRVRGVEAFTDDGLACHAERVVATALPVDLYVAWTPGPGAIHRIIARDTHGRVVGDVVGPRPLGG